MKRRPRNRDSATRPASSFALGDTVRYPDGRHVKLTADLCGGRMGRRDGGDLGNWISPDTEVSLVAKYEPASVAMNNTDNETDPLIAASREP